MIDKNLIYNKPLKKRNSYFMSALEITVRDEENNVHNSDEKQISNIKSLHQKNNDIVNVTLKNKNADLPTQHIFKNIIVTAISDENKKI